MIKFPHLKAKSALAEIVGKGALCFMREVK